MDFLKFALFFFFFFIHLVYSAYHSLVTTYTGVMGATAGNPEFSAVTTLDGQQIDYYDSNIQKLIPRQDWMQEFVSQEIWKEDTEIRQHVHQIYKDNIHVLMERFNQTHGVHTFQRMYGCWWDDKSGDSHGLDEYGYDGEDFVMLDVKEGRYITPVPQGIITVHKWNDNRERFEILQQYYKHECVQWLGMFLKAMKADIKSRGRAPEVSLLQRDPSSPVVCHATGFYPSDLRLTWLKNEQEYHHEDVDLGEMLLNEDGTFQRSSTIIIPPDDWKKHRYSCVVEHMGETIKILTEDEIKSNRPSNILFIMVCVAMGVLVILVLLAITVLKKPNRKAFPSVCENEESYIDKRD